jgi:hemolysin activation/secretion protein
LQNVLQLVIESSLDPQHSQCGFISVAKKNNAMRNALQLGTVVLAVLGGNLPATASATETPVATQTSSPTAPAQPVRFVVKSYQIEGSPQLDKATIDTLLGWLPGPARSLIDLEKAQQLLQSAYQHRGLGSVYVLLPEQEITDGMVRFNVVQGKVGKITVEGNKHFSEANVRHALVSLREGQPLDATKLSENIQLANENPARQLEVALSVDRDSGDIDAKAKVNDDKPLRYFATLDNSGNAATGRHRLGVAVQHSNLFERDHTASLAYTTSPDSPSGVDVGIYSLGYRLPLYPSDSLEMVYGHSNVAIPSGTPALGGVLGLTGKGDVLDLRWNHYLPRVGEYSSHLSFGADSQDLGSACSGLPSGGSVAGCVSYRTLPLSLAYSGKWELPERTLGLELGVRANAGGSSGEALTQASGRTVPQRFKLIKGEVMLTQAIGKWELHLAAQMQLADTPLPASEQFGLAGASAVRGYEERAVVSDEGMVLESELYTPVLALPLPGELRVLVFYDYGHGHDFQAAASSPNNLTLSSAGAGLRYQLRKNVFWRFDFAKPQHAETQPSGARVHFSLTLGY